ncbi:hypothetical protein V9T40_013129 [Parthenolecanium corni]|uniref:Uncharacterized protein n=1 Tax=Parthenolecanium corni TaxID=536013 RepID=A0AAN9Y5S3_9HEMI
MSRLAHPSPQQKSNLLQVVDSKDYKSTVYDESIKRTAETSGGLSPRNNLSSECSPRPRVLVLSGYSSKLGLPEAVSISAVRILPLPNEFGNNVICDYEDDTYDDIIDMGLQVVRSMTRSLKITIDEP